MRTQTDVTLHPLPKVALFFGHSTVTDVIIALLSKPAFDQDNVSEGGSIASDMFGAPVDGGVGGRGGSQFRELDQFCYS